ncbi:hypothetical protein [Flexithrix dorotheae]|uniref:hypothetical protein n=1 Tax=Flexithrix dorotheae TaxID=70993 RepID=UPI0003695F9B|nr:hypothetical protein [Flexithrix dorotheae]
MENAKNKLKKELKSVFWTSIYFFIWFGALMIIKVLLLREYQIQFAGFTLVLVGALVVAKVVLVLEYVKIPFTKKQPAWVEILIRTLLYLIGVFVILTLEKSFEARDEYDGVVNSLKDLAIQLDIYHLWVNIICVFGALFFFNLWTVVKKHFGPDIFRKIMKTPIPQKPD